MVGKRYLIVDDEEAIRSTLVEIMQLMGEEADSAENGLTALQKINDDPNLYRAVFLDLYMPDMDGMATFAGLREIVPEMPVYFVTGYATDDLEEEIMEKGAAGLLSKPFRVSELKEILDRLKEE